MNPLDYVRSAETVFSSAENFRINSHLPVIDELTSSLTERIEAYDQVNGYFGFLSKLDTEEILSSEEILKKADNLLKLYENDIEEGLKTELLQFKEFPKKFILREKDKKLKNEVESYKLLIDKKH